jgi:hypothetical protein
MYSLAYNARYGSFTHRYYVRTGSFSAGGSYTPLSRSCQVRGCGLKGHNSSNHPPELRNMLRDMGYMMSTIDWVATHLDA